MHKLDELNDNDIAKATTFANSLIRETTDTQMLTAAAMESASRQKMHLAQKVLTMKRDKLMAMDQFLSSISLMLDKQ